MLVDNEEEKTQQEPAKVHCWCLRVFDQKLIDLCYIKGGKSGKGNLAPETSKTQGLLRGNVFVKSFHTHTLTIVYV